MRVENDIHIRHIMRHHFEKGWKTAQSFRDLNELFGEDTITKNCHRESFSRFKSGDISLETVELSMVCMIYKDVLIPGATLEDKPERGCPLKFNDQALLLAVKGVESLTTRMLAANFNVDHSTIACLLKKLEKGMEIGWMGPHELNDNDKVEHVRIFTDLLQRNEWSPFLKDLVTEEELWLFFKNLKRRKVCVLPRVSPKGITKNVNYKRLCCVFGTKVCS
ncbi:HTH_48 domain-containing protein [Trichonephila clavipes]|nr:HTH_48 domain-containing protein [Trichonephila clavipes]